jgi:hypothetical protein
LSFSVRSTPCRRTVIVAGVAATQPSVFSPPAHLCEAIFAFSVSKFPRTPSTSTSLSPGASTPRAGAAVTRSILFVGSLTPVCQISTIRIRNASAMLTAGPAPITTTRFHTGWRK